jgi:signal transduction histidine kinase
MDPDFLAQATARFTRADAARSTAGTGLGLAVVDAIIGAHHGELRICANGTHHRIGTSFPAACRHPDHGTTITVLLPAADPPAPAKPGRTP